MLEEMVADLKRVLAINDAAERARELTRLIRELPALSAAIRAERQAAVVQLRAAGWSHQQVADLLGVARNRAQQIAEGRSGGPKRRPAADADDADDQ